MPYTAADAIQTFYKYLDITKDDVSVIPETKGRGIVYSNKNDEKCVIFISPISYSAYNDKGFFDTRDSGPKERVITWNYAIQNGLKYFNIAVQDVVEKYKNYIFSLECNEDKIQSASGSSDTGRRISSGTQIVIGRNCLTNQKYERFKTEYGFFISDIHKDYFEEYLLVFDNRPYTSNLEQIRTNPDITDLGEEIKLDSHSPLRPPPFQTIYYGVPGSGKSHRIDEETKDIPDDQKIRVVFHPEYTNADFVGQVLPIIDEGVVKYTFKPGPFTRVLVSALKSPDKPYYLIIEEINRGNAAAIFGEIFQLLDRGIDGKSSYCIMNDDINYEIRKSVPELNWTANTGIRLPPNLSLYATMNTSDQNVFTLDNAFQRRWDMKLVENKFEGADAEMQRNAKIGGSDVTWETFQTHINRKIGEMSSSMGMSSMEDKRLGCWFVKVENGLISKESFAEKVLKYLWDDAFKFNRDEIFDIKDKSTSLESIIQSFKNGNSACNWGIFKDTSFVSVKNMQEQTQPVSNSENNQEA